MRLTKLVPTFARLGSLIKRGAVAGCPVHAAGMGGRVRVREIDNEEGNPQKRFVRRGSGSVVTWRRAQVQRWAARHGSLWPARRLRRSPSLAQPIMVCRSLRGACRSWLSSSSPGVVDDTSHESLRLLFREEGVTFQQLKTGKAATDPHCAAKKARVGQLY